jgi:hypothetical protein
LRAYKVLADYNKELSHITRYCTYKDGLEEGNGFVLLCDKDKKSEKMRFRFQTEYHNGLEVIKSQSLDHLDGDRWIPNLILCSLTFITLIAGAIVDMRIAYFALAFYFMQFCDFYCSLTKIILPNIDCDTKTANLLAEYIS